MNSSIWSNRALTLAYRLTSYCYN